MANPLEALRRAYLSLTRGLIMGADDSKPIQTVSIRLLPNELPTTVERLTTYGFHSVPLPPDGGGSTGAEAVVAFMHGNRSHPVVVGDIDRRTKPKNLKPGESQHHDDQGQNSHIARDGHYHTAKKHVVTAGHEPATTFELNEQLKGLAARQAQSVHNIHGLFDATSRFRDIVQQVIPSVALVQDVLNGDTTTGLTQMADAIEGKAQAYLQTQIQQALAKFLSPNLAGLSSLLGGGIEGLIGNLQGQIGQLLAQNPVVGQVDALRSELAALATSGNEAGTIAEMSGRLQGQIDALTGANPIVGTVTGLRTTLAGMVAQAGPTLNFLGPQQRLVQGLSKSLQIAP